MKNTYFQANLMGINKINVLLFTSINLPMNPKFILEKDGGETSILKMSHHTSNNALSIFELEMAEDFSYGHSYVVVLEGFIRINVDVTNAVDFPNFDKDFFYDGDDLGSIYHKDYTDFALWAPLASEVVLEIEEDNEFHLYKMTRTDKGVYRLSLKGDYLNHRYHYQVTNSGVKTTTNDPYGKGVSLNSEYSVVIDLEVIKKIKTVKPETVIRKNTDAIIYETSVRDFTEDNNTDIENKGKFLGLVEAYRHTNQGNPAGLDYLKFLGITHVQILPVMDFFGNDDLDPKKSYNWGYNPLSFFAIEGSYSTKPEDAINRLVEFREMVDILHKNNIRVVMDVVYNHVYEYLYSVWEKTVPGYFFRKRNNGLPAIASGCGNDFASEKLMARKMILDSLKYFTEVFEIDGYRFDLMGLLDIETVNQAFKMCRSIKDDIIFYGEGWNMGYELPFDKKACSDNADKMPGIAFFNDLYRDVIRGGNFRDSITQKGFIGGNQENNEMVNYVLRGSTIDVPCAHRYKTIEQSLNYVECHDNNTLFDKLSFSNEDENEDVLLKRVKFANQIVALSFGIAFFHMGQEIGLSKAKLDNTYNVLKINNMDWKLVDERFDMVEDLACYIRYRKYIQENFNLTDKDGKATIFEHQFWGNGVIAYFTDKKGHIEKNKRIAALINPTLEAKSYELDDYYSILVDLDHPNGCSNTKNGILPPLHIQLLYIREDNNK